MVESQEDDKKLNLKIENLEVTSKWSVEEYNFITVDCYFNLSKHLDIQQVGSFDLRLRIQDFQFKRSISRDLKVKVKSTESKSKKSAMICGKCLHLKKSDDLLFLKWWIVLNKKIGYEKIRKNIHV
jgi:hypothetical protein